MRSTLVGFALLLVAAAAAAGEPISDDRRIETSTSLPAGVHLVPDASGNGAIHVMADGVTLDLSDVTLAGAPDGASSDELTGRGVVVEGRKDVTIRGGRIRGYKVAVRAIDCENLRIEGVDVSGNYRQRLGSTPEREDTRDWLWPHENDDLEWETRYGAGISLTDCPGAVVTDCRARRGQNGLLLTRCDGARVGRCDFSFLSGWGLAMWRSSRCSVVRNRFDWCVRGYSHGVYDRGQDSTGILVFEQCHDNVFAYNSATHGGDGFFLYAGHETTKKTGRGGCNGNLLYRNDFSHAVANGIEATFSARNVFLENRLDDCRYGVWAGYSRDTVVRGNVMRGCGTGVAIEHGHGNRIEENVLDGCVTGIKLWWDEDEEFLEGAFGKRQDTSSSRTTIRGNRIAGSRSSVDLVRSAAVRVLANEILDTRTALSLRDDCAGLRFEGNVVQSRSEFPVLAAKASPIRLGPNLWLSPFGATGEVTSAEEEVARPRPARWRPLPSEWPFLPPETARGRERILVDEWGPYDFVAPRLWPARAEGGAEATLRVLGDGGRFRVIETTGGLAAVPAEGETPATIRIAPDDEGGSSLRTGRVVVEVGGKRLASQVTLLRATWTVCWFAWKTDPREDAEAFAKLLTGEPLATRTLPALDLRYGGGGPAEGVPSDRFVTVAETTLDLPAGTYEIVTVSDDGVRVRSGDRTILENWTWHGPTEDEATIEHGGGPLPLRVEHFELDGWAVLSVRIRRVP